MRFFTSLACYAIHHGNHTLLLVAQAVGDKNLVAADMLVAAAKSPRRYQDMMWETITCRLDNDLNDPACIATALQGTAESDYVPAFRQMMDAAKRLEMDVDTDDLLIRMARHGAHDCWLYAMTALKLQPSIASLDVLTDAAVEGGNGRILMSLEHTTSLPYEYRMRIHWKRKLDEVVRGRNPDYIRKVLINAEWLKASDLLDAERLALRTGNAYLKKSVIDPIMDEAIGRWTVFLNTRPKTTGNVVELPLKKAA